jgi:hypothetical protein
MNYLKNRFLKVGAVLLLALVLLIVAAVPSLADTPTTTPKVKITPAALHSAQGKVDNVTANKIVLRDGGEPPITLIVNDNTTYYMLSLGRAQGFYSSVFPRGGESDKNLPNLSSALKNFRLPNNWKDDFGWMDRFGAKAKPNDVAVGDRIIARLAADSFLAKQVLIIKTPVPLILQVKGMVTVGTSTGTIAIQPTTGAEVSVKWDANTRVSLKGLIAVQTGQYATATYNRNTLVALTLDVQATAPTPRATPTLRTNTETH